MSASEEEVRKQQAEDKKKPTLPGDDRPPPEPTKSHYEPPKSPELITGSLNKEGGKDVKEVNLNLKSPEGDGVSIGVVQNDAKKTTTATVGIKEADKSVEIYAREQPGAEAAGVKIRVGSGDKNIKASVEHDNETDRTSGKLERQDGKDKQVVIVSGGKGGSNVSVSVTEDMGKNGTITANGSTNLKDRFNAGVGYSDNGISSSFSTEKTTSGWTNTYGGGVEKGRVKVEAILKDAPDKPPEVSVKGTINVGPTPGKAEPTFWDKPSVKQTPGEGQGTYGEFSRARDQLSPEDRKLYETSLAAVTKAIESGKPPELSKFKGREEEFAINVAVQAKTLGMSQVADIGIQSGPNGQPLVRLGEKPLDDPSLNNREGPSSKTISLNALDKPPMEALNDLRNTVPEKGRETTQVPSSQQTNEIPNVVPIQESSPLRR
ncbi:MAG: hypothetical protein HOP03_09225 [Lysobacter sp.]|nr:hypothetical protein [Lysobacter sp.]